MDLESRGAAIPKASESACAQGAISGGLLVAGQLSVVRGFVEKGPSYSWAETNDGLTSGVRGERMIWCCRIAGRDA